MKTTKDFAKLVNDVMEEQKLKNRDVADMAGVSEGCVNGLRNCYNTPTISNLCKILWALGFDIALVEKDIGV